MTLLSSALLHPWRTWTRCYVCMFFYNVKYIYSKNTTDAITAFTPWDSEVKDVWCKCFETLFGMLRHTALPERLYNFCRHLIFASNFMQAQNHLDINLDIKIYLLLGLEHTYLGGGGGVIIQNNWQYSISTELIWLYFLSYSWWTSYLESEL